MARYPDDYKIRTRRRIIAAAGRRLKRDGIDGSGVATLMKDVDLTNGAFYAHFSSKNDLVATVVEDQMATQVALIEEALDDPSALPRFVDGYLSIAHRDDPAAGCPSAALLDEIARSGPEVRHAYRAGVQRILDVVAAHLSAAHGVDPDTAWNRALGIYTILVATVQLSRAVDDPDISEDVLRAGAANALSLIPANS
jgi:AcrR family transcriptional regulator